MNQGGNMPSFLEFDAKTVELALQKASKSLKIPIKQIKHDVISYGSTGIFGLVGSRKARIRVNIPDGAGSISESQNQAVEKNLSNESETSSEIQSKENVVLSDGLLKVDNAERQFVNLVDTGKDTLEKILNLISSDADVIAKEDTDNITFSIQSENPSIIIGKRGKTIEAIQYIVEKIINKQADKKIGVQIDIGDYLKKKQEKLQNLAEKMAKKAKRSGKPSTISKLNAYNRRIIHLALKNDNEVKTVSIGKNFLKKLVIFPVKKPSSKK